MILGSVFQRFVEECPIAVMGRAVLQRMLEPDRIDQLFRDHAQNQYESELLFSSLTRLMADVVLKVRPSVYAAYQSGNYHIPVAPRSLYEKLKNTETQISEALVGDSATHAAELIDAMAAEAEPWLPGYRCRILDGCHLEATQHRLLPLRFTWDAPLPGTALAVLDQDHMLIERAFLIEDGHASERTALDRVIESIRERDLWIADSNFCTLSLLFALRERGACFVIRQHGCLKGELLGEPRRKGRSETGEVHEQQLRIRHPDGREMIVRRVTVRLDRPTRAGDEQIHILSNLPEEEADALKISELYRQRWTIESAFGQISTTLNCEVDTLCYPKAALFAFCLGLVAYNAVAVLLASLRKAHGERVVQEEISAYYLSLEIRGCEVGMMIAVPPEEWEIFHTQTVQEVAGWLERVARSIDRKRYRKHPRGPKKKPPQRKPYTNGGHLSTARVLQGSPPEQT